MGAWVASRCIGFRRAALAAMAVAVLVLAPAARAGNADQGARAVRLGYVDGTVQLVQDNQVLADRAVANTPLFEGTLVATAGDGRAEIQFEDGSLARLAPNSALLLSVLRGQGSAAQTEITLESGLGYFELQEAGNSGQMRIRFGDTVMSAQAFTVMRIDLDTPPGSLAVFAGNAHLQRGSALTLDLHEGQSVTFDASDASRYTLAETIPQDSWDAWNSDRDQALQAEYADRTGATSNQSDNSNPAWADLDANGNWYNIPGQGYVWSPYDASNSGWDPYGNGYWMWTPAYGYIWVSGYNWGYLPYSCGTWNFYDSFGWGWMPGGGNEWWWGGGGWGPNIGQGPGGYRMPHRPRVNPPRGFPRDTNAGINHRPLPPHSIVPVSRRLSGLGGGFPARNGNTPVVIAGHPVPPVRPIVPRTVYGGGTFAGAGNHTQPAFPYGARPPQGVRPSAGSGLRSSSPGSTSFTSGGGSTLRPFGSGSGSPPDPPSNTVAPGRPSPGGSGGSKPSSGGGGWFHRGNFSSGSSSSSHSWGSRNGGGSSHSGGGSRNSGGSSHSSGGSRNSGGSSHSGGSGAHAGGGGGSHGGGSHR